MKFIDVDENFRTGYVKIFRSIKKHWIWEDENYLKMWIDFLMRANHQPNKVLIDRNVEEVNRGSFITSLKKLSLEYHCSIGRIRHFLDLLKKEKMIEVITTNKWTQITICKYSTYQDSQHTERNQNENRMKSNRKQNETENNVKNVNNDKNENRSIPETLMIKSFGRMPKSFEVQEINQLLNKYDYTTVERSMISAAREGVKRWKTFIDRLDSNGKYISFDEDNKKKSENDKYNKLPPKS